jgi:adenosine deaminase
MKKIAFFLSLWVIPSFVFAQQLSENKTNDYFNTIKKNPTQLSLFLKSMPKGGDLHHHLSGASYAENIIKYGLNHSYCIDPSTLTASINQQCHKANTLAAWNNDWLLRNTLIDAWSMRNLNKTTNNSHDHFFNTFYKFSNITDISNPQMLTEVTERAGEQHEIYLETMITTDVGKAMNLGNEIPWQNNLDTMYQAFETAGIQKIVDDINRQIAHEQVEMKNDLQCGTPHAKSGCLVTQRYLYAPVRVVPKNQVFAQLMTGFLLAHQNPLVVGVNFVGAEDDLYALQDYKEHMKMFNFLHQKFPDVKISLHAGELWAGLVTPETLQNHIHDAIVIGHANRLDHAVDIKFENNTKDIIALMKKNHISITTSLTSNADVLGVTGQAHPFMFYLAERVPIALSTDDEGVLRTSLTGEFQRAVETYDLSYSTLKMLARNSLSASFISGDSLWLAPEKAIPVKACSEASLGDSPINKTCEVFLKNSPKAQLQWKLEGQFNQFEAQYR